MSTILSLPPPETHLFMSPPNTSPGLYWDQDLWRGQTPGTCKGTVPKSLLHTNLKENPNNKGVIL